MDRGVSQKLNIPGAVSDEWRGRRANSSLVILRRKEDFFFPSFAVFVLFAAVASTSRAPKARVSLNFESEQGFRTQNWKGF